MSTRYKARTARNKAFPDVYGARIHIHIFLVVARFVLGIFNESHCPKFLGPNGRFVT